MNKKLKVFWIKLKWVLFGKKKLKEVQKEIREEKGIKRTYLQKHRDNGRANFASTKGYKPR